jgi:hypothetical protein
MHRSQQTATEKPGFVSSRKTGGNDLFIVVLGVGVAELTLKYRYCHIGLCHGASSYWSSAGRYSR